MKKIVLFCLLPFVIAVSAVLFSAFQLFPKSLFSQPYEPVKCFGSYPYLTSFSENPCFEKEFLAPHRAKNTIYVLGSSELTEGGEAIPYNFIPKHFKHSRVIGFGHAGNQCFSIFSQLLANPAKLNGAKIVFIISPGWFESKPTKGTSSQIFLEYNPESFLKRILYSHVPEDSIFKAYAEKRVADLYSEFNSPNLPLKLMNFEHQFSKSIFHKAMYAPFMMLDHHLLLKKKHLLNTCNECPPERREPIRIIPSSDTVMINWDSLLYHSKQDVLKKVTNNDIGIEDSYYSRYINDKRGKIQAVKKSLNQELEDFKMLVRLAKEKNINASFVISPLNAYYFKNLKDIQPTIDIIENEIKQNGFSYLNLLATDTASYEKALLHDVMHMTDYGWYKVDKYLIEKYQPEKYEIEVISSH
jgi:D-alanine transfer protein